MSDIIPARLTELIATELQKMASMRDPDELLKHVGSNWWPLRVACTAQASDQLVVATAALRVAESFGLTLKSPPIRVGTLPYSAATSRSSINNSSIFNLAAVSIPEFG